MPTDDRTETEAESNAAPADPTEPAFSPPLPGNVALREWFSEKRGRRGGLAAALGVSIGTVSGWGRERNPTRPHEALHLFAIEKLADIPLAAWLAPAELEALAPVLDNWQDHVYVPQRRRQAVDPRQMHIDELLARRAEQGAPQDLPPAAREAEDDPPLDIDSMMGETS